MDTTPSTVDTRNSTRRFHFSAGRTSAKQVLSRMSSAAYHTMLAFWWLLPAGKLLVA